MVHLGVTKGQKLPKLPSGWLTLLDGPRAGNKVLVVGDVVYAFGERAFGPNFTVHYVTDTGYETYESPISVVAMAHAQVAGTGSIEPFCGEDFAHIAKCLVEGTYIVLCSGDLILKLAADVVGHDNTVRRDSEGAHSDYPITVLMPGKQYPTGRA